MGTVPHARLPGLLALLMAVVATGFVLERLRPVVPPEISLLGIQAEDVVGIRVSTDRRELRATRRGTAWRIDTPSVTRPDAAAAVAEMVDYLTAAVPVDTFERRDTDGRIFGVEDPRVRIELDVRGRAEQVVLLLGDYAPTGGSVYGVLASEQRIHKIGAAIVSAIEKVFYHTILADEPRGRALGNP